MVRDVISLVLVCRVDLCVSAVFAGLPFFEVCGGPVCGCKLVTWLWVGFPNTRVFQDPLVRVFFYQNPRHPWIPSNKNKRKIYFIIIEFDFSNV